MKALFVIVALFVSSSFALGQDSPLKQGTSLSFASKSKCTNQCSSGDKTCSGGGYKTCQKGSNGCYAWSDVKKCGSNEKCDNGKCVAKSCKDMGYYDSCAIPTNTACKGNNPYKCKVISATRWCWEKISSCSSNEVCKDPFGPTGAHCEKKCTDQCSGGDRKCDGNGYKTCEKGSSGCYAWGSVKQCGSNEKCDSGKCVAICKNECSNGDKRCDGSGYQACQKDGNGCLKWSGTTKCGSNEKCDAGKCVAKCSDQCSNGQKKCDGNGYVACQKDKNGCFAWGSNTACKSGQKCDGGNCAGSGCEITNAYWSAADNWAAITVKDGDSVTLIAKTNGKCKDDKLTFRIMEADFASADDKTAELDTQAASDGIVKASWKAAWIKDCIADICGDPEYYFQVYVNGEKKYDKSPLMWVTKSYDAEVAKDNTIVVGKNVGEAASAATLLGVKFPPEVSSNKIILRYPAPNDLTKGERFLELRVNAPHANWNYQEAVEKYAAGEMEYAPSWIGRYLYHINLEGKVAKTVVSAIQKIGIPLSNPGNLHLPLPSPTSVLTMIIMEAPFVGGYDEGFGTVTVVDGSGNKYNASFSCGSPAEADGYECMFYIPNQGRCYCKPSNGAQLSGSEVTLDTCRLTRCEAEQPAADTNIAPTDTPKTKKTARIMTIS